MADSRFAPANLAKGCTFSQYFTEKKTDKKLGDFLTSQFYEVREDLLINYDLLGQLEQIPAPTRAERRTKRFLRKLLKVNRAQKRFVLDFKEKLKTKRQRKDSSMELLLGYK